MTPEAAADRPLRADAERNRLRVLEAARELFAERGLSVTLDDIAHHAGVGVGTVYRRFPDKEALIDALFEQRIGEMTEVAREGLADPDAMAGLEHFLERGLELQAQDRGLKELMHDTGLGTNRVAHARSQIAPMVLALVARAQESGQLRADAAGPDIPLITLMIGGLMDRTREVNPEVWRRMLTIVLDGLRVRPGVASEMPVPPLDLDDVPKVMRGPKRR